MPKTPHISIQLVHIKGPLKGQIQDFSDFPITIGRHSTSLVRFPNDLSTISRHHARIERQETRFRLVDASTNGTFVNGKRISDVYLRDGDVLTFSESGPKASFLTKIEMVEDGSSLPSPGANPEASFTEPALTVGPDQDLEVLSSQAPLAIQFGETLQSYNLLPVTIGTDPQCDFVIAAKHLEPQHVQIFFFQEEYYIKDLTGKMLASINDRPIGNQAVLAQGAEISLTAKGPKFKFLGGGRLAEME